MRSAVLFTLLACACQPQDLARAETRPTSRPSFPRDLGTRAFAHVEKLVSFGERRTGTPGWTKSVDYIASTLEGLGLAVTRDRWTEDKEQVQFENLIARLPGSSSDRILLAAHHDTKRCSGHDDAARNFPFVGANDSASGVAMLLVLAEELKKQAARRATIELVFFDGEESMTWEWHQAARALFGSRRFVREEKSKELLGKSAGKIRTLVLVDMVGSKDLQIDDDTNSDHELRQLFAAAARACGHERVFFKEKQTVSDDHLPFVEAGYKAIDIVDIADNPEWHTERDTIDRMAPSSLQIIAEVLLHALPEIERSFVPAPAASQPRVLR